MVRTAGVDLKATDALNLGEVLRGARIYETPYDFKMKSNQQCKILCRSEYDKEEIEAFALMTEEEYRVNLLLDNLPGLFSDASPLTLLLANPPPLQHFHIAHTSVMPLSALLPAR